METFNKQRERHQGGDKWIGTGGTSPYGAYGSNPFGIRVGQDGNRNFSAAKVWDKRKYINLDDAIKKFAVANGIDTGGLIKSSEQIQQEAQAQQQQQFANQALADPRVAIEAGKSLANSGASVNANGEIETEE